MSNQTTARSCLVIFALTMGVATAATPSDPRPDPADPAAVAPPMNYRSAFSDYQPFRDQEIRSWKEVNQEVAENPGMGPMGSMKDMPGKEGAASRGMGSMNAMQDKTKASMDKPVTAQKNVGAGGGHHVGAMKDMPGKSALAMVKPQPAPGQPNAQIIAATGVVQAIDRANGKVKLTHDPIASLGWPKMTMFFRLKDNSLAQQLKEGDKVEFSMEKLASGYVISDIRKAAAHEMKHPK